MVAVLTRLPAKAVAAAVIEGWRDARPCIASPRRAPGCLPLKELASLGHGAWDDGDWGSIVPGLFCVHEAQFAATHTRTSHRRQKRRLSLSQ